MLELKDLNPRRNSTWLQSQHNRTFIGWLKNEVFLFNNFVRITIYFLLVLLELHYIIFQ
jgi:hypothetical protein